MPEIELLEQMAERLRVMGHPMRLMIIGTLKAGEASTKGLSDRFQAPPSSISQHLKALEGVGLLSKRREGSQVLYRVQSPLVSDLCTVICEQMERDLAHDQGKYEAFERLRSQLQG